MKTSLIRQILPLLLIFSGAAFVVYSFLPPRTASPYDLAGLGRLPVQFGTRVLPIDSVARNTLRLFSHYTSVSVPERNSSENVRTPSIQWFLDVAFRPEVAEKAPVFRVDLDELLGLLGREQQGITLLSFHDLSPHFEDIQKAAQAADDKKEQKQPLSAFDREVSRLRDNLILFQRLTVSFVPPGSDPAEDWKIWQASLKPGADAVLASDSGQPADQNILNAFVLQAQRFMNLGKTANVGLLPPAKAGDPWTNLGQGAIAALRGGQVNPILQHYGDLGTALRHNDPAAFNAAVAALQQDLAASQVASKVRFESFVNQVEPFFCGALLYAFAFFCACISWTAWGPELRRAALWLVIFGFAIQTFGLGARVYLTGFGVVTNLYSSALFVGWVAVLFGLVLELWKKNAVGAAAAAFVGFATLIIAHSLPFNGDDLELPQAVLASNLWLWTHVKCIVSGYGAMFVAGTLGAGYILASAVSTKFTSAKARELAQLVYGVTCFATLFSFVGTMLGGIWADQSWGRFWGWDPKENGALLIVLWCAICLHARWGKLCSERTQMALAVGGNMVTAWSWFGVNLLGVGLHSYGFMQGTFWALIAFWLSQLVIIAIAFLPKRHWKNQSVATTPSQA